MTILMLSGNPPVKVAWDKLLDAIAYTETRKDHTAVGKHGERGAWQMRHPSWQDVNDWRVQNNLVAHPFDKAHDAIIAREYASRYAGILYMRLVRALGCDPTVQQLWACWNLGFGGFKRLTFDIARVQNSTRRGLARLESYIRNIQPHVNT